MNLRAARQAKEKLVAGQKTEVNKLGAEGSEKDAGIEFRFVDRSSGDLGIIVAGWTSSAWQRSCVYTGKETPQLEVDKHAQLCKSLMIVNLIGNLHFTYRHATVRFAK